MDGSRKLNEWSERLDSQNTSPVDFGGSHTETKTKQKKEMSLRVPIHRDAAIDCKVSWCIKTPTQDKGEKRAKATTIKEMSLREAKGTCALSDEAISYMGSCVIETPIEDASKESNPEGTSCPPIRIRLSPDTFVGFQLPHGESLL